MKRQTFDSVSDLVKFMRANAAKCGKKTPWKITMGNGTERFVLACNSDQAIAAASREFGTTAQGVDFEDLFVAN